MIKKNILVTGGAGFIGFHLCKRLLSEGHKVISIDNLISGRIENIDELKNNNNFQFFNHDITKPYYVSEIDEIYNLACPASPMQYQKNPIKTVKTCTIGVINILGIARANNSKILQASTSEIYGDPEVHPQKENYNGNVNTTGIRSCYDEGKRCSETLFMDYHRQHGLRIKIARIFNTYGPNMSKDDGRVISNFVMQAINDKPITIYGDGNQTRCFQYIDDLIDGLILLMESEDEFTGPVNFGNTNEISMNELASLILKMSNSSSEIKYLDLPDDDPKRRKPDCNLSFNKLNWKTNVDLTHGLENTIQYFKKLNENNQN